ncbi:MAG TPA: 6-carboxytetrahydropterin synthase [Bacteroidia bacterium]|nr:6-carboxytetrahydropterin synthase [Bacteroidia bacterium]
MIYITRKERFNAAHKLYKPEWSEEKNREVFGKCSNPNWHGHNYVLFITVKGMPNPETGFVIDLKVLSQIVKENVIDPLDHKNINLDVKFMQGIMASTEMLAMQIWNQLHDAIRSQGAMLHVVKLYETENNFVEYFGNEK